MSNLGVHAVWALINSTPGWAAERAFLPSPELLGEHRRTNTPLLTVESARPAAECDLLAFSLSYELDEPNIVRLLKLAGIPIYAEEREEQHPLVALGGACCSLNVEPVAPFFDFVVVGEAEAVLPAVLEVLSARLRREDALRELAALHGVYVPLFYHARETAQGPELEKKVPEAALPVIRQAESDLDAHDTATQILTPHTEFAGVRLVEVSRGCPRGCRFCVVPWALRPFRFRSAEKIAALARGTERVGLLGAAASEHPQFEEIVRQLSKQGHELTLSASRTENLSEGALRALARAGMRTLTLAPETADDALRRMLGKQSTAEDFLRVARAAGGCGFRGLRLYFLVGVPGTGADEAEQILSFSAELAAAASGASVTISVGPLIPKPFTPLQWAAMPATEELEEKLRKIARGGRKLRPQVAVSANSARWATIEALLSRGDRALAPCLVRAAEEGASFARWLRIVEEQGLSVAHYVHRARPAEERFPWEVLRVGPPRESLLRLARGIFGGLG